MRILNFQLSSLPTMQPTQTSFAGDFFLKDHLGNIRMVLTDEQQVNYYPTATLDATYSYGAPEPNSIVN